MATGGHESRRVPLERSGRRAEAPSAVGGGRTNRAVSALRRSAAVERVRASLWFVPSLFVAGAGGAAALLSQIEVDDTSPWRNLVFGGGADSARAILQAIAGSVITVTGVVFSLTVVTLQLASTQFSPRLLRTFLRDVSNQIVLGTFLATFVYALLVLRTVRSGAEPQQDVVPELAVTGAYALTAASVVALVYFIDHIARAIRIDSLMREVNEDTAEAMDDLRRIGEAVRSSHGPVPDAPTHAAIVTAPRSGFVQALDHRRLLGVADAVGATVLLETQVGDRVVEGAPIARVWRDGDDVREQSHTCADVTRAIRIGYERTLQQDIAFGFRQLVDIAVKALSPGVNDPTTAVHAIGHLSALLVRVSAHPLGTRVVTTPTGRGCVVVRAMDLRGYLDLACGQIRRYGAAEPVVMVELLRMLRDVAHCELDRVEAATVAREVEKVVAAAARSTAEPSDVDAVHALAHEVLTIVDGRRGPP